MKKSVVALSVFAALFLFVPSLATADPTHPCEVGLYMTPDAYGATGTHVIGAPVDLFLVLSKPCDEENNDGPFMSIYGFECGLHFFPVPDKDLYYMGADLQPGAIDVSIHKDINQGFLDFMVGTTYSNPIPIINDQALLATLHFFNTSSTETAVTLTPQQRQSIPDHMAFLGNNQPNGPPTYLRIMHSISGSRNDPVFFFNGEAVAVENESFGSVKALYR